MENFNATASAGTSSHAPMMQLVISSMTSDMRTLGILNIVFGGLYCLSIIGAIIGVPLIIGGMRLRESADAFSRYRLSVEPAILQHALERQSKFFSIQKILLLVGLVLLVLYIIGMIIFGLSLLAFFLEHGSRF